MAIGDLRMKIDVEPETIKLLESLNSNIQKLIEKLEVKEGAEKEEPGRKCQYCNRKLSEYDREDICLDCFHHERLSEGEGESREFLLTTIQKIKGGGEDGK